MNITNVTVTKVAEESTENADYQLEYSIVNDALHATFLWESRLHPCFMISIP